MVSTRRAIFAAGLATFSAVAGNALACTFRLPGKVSFNDAKCRRKIADFVRLINDADRLSPEDVSARLEGIKPDDAIIEDYDSFEEWVLDFRDEDQENEDRRRPVQLVDINLLNAADSRALYQITLARFEVRSGDDMGCFSPYAEMRQAAFLCTFVNNEFKKFKNFPDWPLPYQKGSMLF